VAAATEPRASHKRTPAIIATALVKESGKHARALANIFRLCDRPATFLRRYLRGGGTYPDRYTVKTPIGPVPITVFTPDDLMTINEIFFRGDYPGDTRERIYVDFGSNVGISTLFWLTRNARNFVYCYEPLPQNIERFRQNLAGFEEKFELHEVAVGIEDGEVEFGWEPTGRYGGIGLDFEKKIRVPCVDSNAQLSRILEKHGRIGVLKIDIESLERELTERILMEDAAKIDRIVVENKFPANPHAATHAMTWKRPITRFERRG
jgi:FkbM family methyltransferase